MSTTVQNIVQKHTSVGAKKVQKDTEAIGKAQTRLGQASASAGRQFSAQATGLGGIVSAYAGAAANIFALTAAFFALRRAAEFEQIISGTNALASSIGEAGTTIIQNIQDITKGQLSLVEAAQTANLALASGFGTEQIDALTEVSLRASKALGRNLSDSFTRVVRGAAKLEPELLDELGIFTRIDPAVRKYANSIGVSASSLTNFERRQAFVNAVIEEGQQKFRDVDTDTETSAQSLERLGTAVVDTGLKFGALIANALAPVADFISGNLSNTFALFGILARVVGAQAIQVFDVAISKASASIVSFGERGALFINNLSRAFTKAQATAQQYAAATIQFSRFGKQEEVQRRQNVQALLQEVATTERLTKARYQEIRAKLIEARQDQLNIAARIKNTTEKNKATGAAFALGRRIVFLDRAQKAALPGTAALTTAVRGLGVAVGFVGRQFNRLFGIITTVITVISTLQLVVDAIAGALGFKNFSILEKLVTFLQKFVGLFTANTEVADAFVSANKSLIDSNILLNKSFEDRKKILDDIRKKTSEFITEFTRLTNLQGRARTLEALRLVTRKGSDEAKQGIALIVDQLEKLGRGNVMAGMNAIKATQLLAAETGISVQKFVDLIDTTGDVSNNFKLIVTDAGNLQVKLGETRSTLTRLDNGIVKFRRNFEKSGPIVASIAQKLDDFFTDFEVGTLNSERAAQRVGAIQSLINRLQKDFNDLRQRGADFAALEIQNLLRQAQIQKELAAALSRQITTTDKLAASLRKVFGTPGEKIGRLDLTGEVGAGGSVATSSREKQANQAIKLNSIVEKNLSLRSQLGDADIQALADRKAEVKEITKLQEQLQKIAADKQLGIKTDEDAKQLAADLVDKRKNLAEIEERLSEDSSLYLETQKAAKIAAQQLLLERIKIAASIEKENDTLEKSVNKLRVKDLALGKQIADIRDKITLQTEKRITSELLAQLDAREKFLKGVGALTRDEELEFAAARNRLTISAAETDKKFQEALINRQETVALAQLEIQKRSNDITLNAAKANVQATISLIRAINKNTDAIMNQGVEPGKEKSVGTGLDTFLLKEQQRLTLLSKLNDQFAKAEFAKRKEQIILNAKQQREANEANFAEIKLLAMQEFELKLQNAKLSNRLFKGINTVVGENLTRSLNEMFDAIAQGQFTLKSFRDGFNDFLFNLLNDIRKQFLKETLIDPIRTGATGILRDLFSVGQAADTVGFAGSMNSSIIGSTDTRFDAEGGPVRRMAAGGITRDRVPALLEPGEFVMKRSAARSIGEANLQSMNSTGTAGNVAVNIINQGTPQESEQASQPRFDGEKFVIDIVTRDLRNNGPIRKSLRGAS